VKGEWRGGGRKRRGAERRESRGKGCVMAVGG